MQNILFLTLSNVFNIDESGIYQDLLREFARNGNRVFVVSPTERKNREKTHLIKNDNAIILRVQTGNIQKTNALEKGISTLLLESQFVAAIKKCYSDVKFDLVLYSTPPITLVNAVKFIKNRDNASTYLMLKDIFPQNAIDLGMLSKKGIKGILYRYFRQKEKKLYELSDRIGCMSQANVDYILKHNPEIAEDKVEICPNCIEIQDMRLTEEEKILMRNKYGISLNKKVFVYGGNLGKPQGIPFLIECLKSQEKNEEIFFLIVGNGTEYGKLEHYFDEDRPQNMKLMRSLPKDDYDQMIAACDVGMIFLDYRFTIPNFPSRILSYMQAGLPILACTDKNTDIGQVITEGGFGWWCESRDVEVFEKLITTVVKEKFETFSENAFRYLKENYTVEQGYKKIKF